MGGTGAGRVSRFCSRTEVLRSWYPACRSRDLRPGQVLPFDIQGRRLVAYRDADGAAHVLDGTCPHLGADLRHGRVDGDGLRCALHDRRYGPDGACPAGPGLTAYPVAESWGLLWCHVGGEPDAPPPNPEGRLRVHRPRRTPAHVHLLTANLFDRDHLGPLHGVELVGEPVGEGDGVTFRFRLPGRWRWLLGRARDAEATFTAHGCNTTRVRVGAPLDFEVLMAGRPATRGGTFVHPALAFRRGPLSALRAYLLVRVLTWRDEEVLSDMQFHRGYGKRDEALRRFVERVEGMPPWERAGPEVPEAARGANRRRPGGLNL